jgi:hypothetical protein
MLFPAGDVTVIATWLCAPSFVRVEGLVSGARRVWYPTK